MKQPELCVAVWFPRSNWSKLNIMRLFQIARSVAITTISVLAPVTVAIVASISIRVAIVVVAVAVAVACFGRNTVYNYAQQASVN